MLSRNKKFRKKLILSHLSLTDLASNLDRWMSLEETGTDSVTQTAREMLRVKARTVTKTQAQKWRKNQSQRSRKKSPHIHTEAEREKDMMMMTMRTGCHPKTNKQTTVTWSSIFTGPYI
ncbi:uncharacterized protein V6R79_007547 [Siganus canaliculatus]